MAEIKLTAKQQLFCDEYLIDLNATQAAIRAGYSEKTAMEQASRLLRNVKVQKYIDKRRFDRMQRTEFDQDKVIKELAMIAFSKATDYTRIVEKQATINVEGVIVPLEDADGKPVMYRTVEPVLTEELTDEQKRALSMVVHGKNGLEIKSCDKLKALELLGKHLGLFTDRVEMDVTQPVFGGEDELED